MTFANGDSYFGPWKNDMMHCGLSLHCDHKKINRRYPFYKLHPAKNCRGRVNYVYSENDEMCVKGQYIWANRTVYVGEFKKNKKQGRGKIKYFNGDTYDGEWGGGLMHGIGTYIWNTGSIYVGEFQHGQRHGKGTRTWISGAKYFGDWVDDKKHGWGKMSYANGDVYVGFWCQAWTK
jgi:hypothetical protein